MKIPIVFGIVGHRNLRTEDHFVLKQKVSGILKGLLAKYTHSEIKMLNSLAEGADQLCCDVAIELGIPYIAVLPMPIEMYQEDFSGEVLTHFNDLLEQAQSVIIVSHPEKTSAMSRDDCYRQSGLYLNAHSHFLLALWDGKGGDIYGCGTASIATEKLMDRDFYEPTLLTGDSGGVVIQIVTPRRQGVIPDHALEVSVKESHPGILEACLESTDEYNQDTEKITELDSSWLIYASMLNDIGLDQRRLHNLYQASDKLSLFFRKRYLRSIKWMSFCAVGLVVAFLLYDELEADIFLYIYGLIMLMTYAIYRRTKLKKYHRKYLEYRVLAETTRTQFFIDIAGIEQNVCAFFNWSQKRKSWIRYALSSIHNINESRKVFDAQSIKRYWIDDQLEYYRNALKKTILADQMNRGISLLMLVCSIVVFLIIFIMEILYKEAITMILPFDSLRTVLIIHPDSVIIVRGMLKILLGLFSSTTLFLSVYYGKLSLRSKIGDYDKMLRIYTVAQNRFEESLITKESLFLDLAREEIKENGNWLEYSQDKDVTLEI